MPLEAYVKRCMEIHVCSMDMLRDTVMFSIYDGIVEVVEESGAVNIIYA